MGGTIFLENKKDKQNGPTLFSKTIAEFFLFLQLTSTSTTKTDQIDWPAGMPDGIFLFQRYQFFNFFGNLVE
jgi:hypothetical protein